MESSGDAKTQTQIIKSNEDVKNCSILTKQVCVNGLNSNECAMIPVQEIAEVLRGNEIRKDFFDQLIVKLPIDQKMEMDVEQIRIKGFPLENRLDLCANGLFNHQITRCLPRVDENDDTIFDLTKKGRKMIDHYRKITKSTNGLIVKNLDKLLISAPVEFVVKNHCLVQYHGANGQVTEYEFYPFNQFKLPFQPYWNEPRLIEKILVWSDKSFPIVVQINDVYTIFKGKSTLDKTTKRHSISFNFEIPVDSVFFVPAKKYVNEILTTKLLNHQNNKIKIIVPDTTFREHLTIETKSFKIVSWETGKDEFSKFF